jgi:hypothetical protein
MFVLEDKSLNFDEIRYNIDDIQSCMQRVEETSTAETVTYRMDFITAFFA